MWSMVTGPARTTRVESTWKSQPLKGFQFFHLFTIYSCSSNFQHPKPRRCRFPFSAHHRRRRHHHHHHHHHQHNGGFKPALAALAAQVPCFSCKGADAMREAVGDMGATTKTGQMAGICWNELGFMARCREKDGVIVNGVNATPRVRLSCHFFCVAARVQVVKAQNRVE